MSNAAFNKLSANIEKKSFLPVYFLEGDETYFIDELAKLLEAKVLTEAEKGFNQQIFYGKETKIQDIIQSCKRYPMMSEHQLILVREAQYLNNLAKAQEFLDYLVNPLSSTVLVMLYKGKKINKNSKVGKALKKYGLMTTTKLYENQMLPWLNEHLVRHKLTMEEKAKYILLEQAGNNLSALASELEKLSTASKDGRIGLKELELMSGLNRSYNVFEYQKALGTRDVEKAMKIARYFGQDQKNNPFILILSNVFNFFKKVHMLQFIHPGNPDAARIIGVNSYFIKDYTAAAQRYSKDKVHEIINHLAEFDRKSKGIGASSQNDSKLLVEMTIKIMD
jgi:DNA polymerase-3 subunit delta